MIGWAAAKLFFGGAIKRLFGALSALWSAMLRYPWQAALAVSLCFTAYLWRGWSAEETDHARTRQAHKAQLEQIEAQSRANLAAALAQVKAVEAKSAQLAKDADHAHELALQDARSATDRYIAANRVRPGRGSVCTAPAAPERNDPGVPADLPPDPGMVAIRETELQELVTWSTVGIEAHNHAVDKINAGLAKVPEGWPTPAFGDTLPPR